MQTHIYYLIAFLGQESGQSLAMFSASGSHQVKNQHSDDTVFSSAGLAEESTPKFTWVVGRIHFLVALSMCTSPHGCLLI